MPGINQLNLLTQLKSAGFHAAFLPYNRIETIAKTYEELAGKNGNLTFLKNTASHFQKNQPPDIPFRPLSFLIIAYPSDPGQIILHVNGKSAAIPIPPTYLDNPADHRRIDEILESAAKGCQTAHSKGISQKMLAVLSGLGRYGRNNVFYVNGLGSFFNLKAFYTDIRCDDVSYPLRFLDECENCGLCRKNCPTGAIGGFPVIDASKCLTLYNENKDPIPDWILPDAHHALIGCLRCQEICPQNKKQKRTIHTLELDEAESKALLSADSSAASAALPAELEQKLLSFGIYKFFLPVIGRNAGLVWK